MPSSSDRFPRPATRLAVRLPMHIVVSVLIIAATAGGLLARGDRGSQQGDQAVSDATETPLPTPVPISSATPLPTPVPTQAASVDRANIVDTAVTFWGRGFPGDTPDALEEIAATFSESHGTGPAGTDAADTDPTPVPAPAAPPPTPAPTATPPLLPLPTLVVEPTPVPLPLPSVDAALPSATVPPLLP